MAPRKEKAEKATADQGKPRGPVHAQIDPFADIKAIGSSMIIEYLSKAYQLNLLI